MWISYRKYFNAPQRSLLICKNLFFWCYVCNPYFMGIHVGVKNERFLQKSSETWGALKYFLQLTSIHYVYLEEALGSSVSDKANYRVRWCLHQFLESQTYAATHFLDFIIINTLILREEFDEKSYFFMRICTFFGFCERLGPWRRVKCLQKHS